MQSEVTDKDEAVLYILSSDGYGMNVKDKKDAELQAMHWSKGQLSAQGLI